MLNMNKITHSRIFFLKYYSLKLVLAKCEKIINETFLNKQNSKIKSRSIDSIEGLVNAMHSGRSPDIGDLIHH